MVLDDLDDFREQLLRELGDQLDDLLARALERLRISPSSSLDERIVATAKQWLLERLINSDYYDWVEGKGESWVDALFLLAAVYFGSAEGQALWTEFKRLLKQDVKGAPKAPKARRLLKFSEARLEEELDLHLQQVLEDCRRGEVPNPRWLEQLYRFSFTCFKRRRPQGLPDWWQQVFGKAMEDLPPGALPPIEGPPPDAPLLPDENVLNAFIEEEKQGSEAYGDILRRLGGRTTPLLYCGDRIMALQFVYVRYRNSPACVSDMTPTPTSEELVDCLNGKGVTNSREGPVTVDNLDRILSRTRERALEWIREAVDAGELPEMDWKTAGVMPKVDGYVEGHLLPELPSDEGPEFNVTGPGGES